MEPVRVEEIEVTLGMMEEVFMLLADCKQPMLNPIPGMLKIKIQISTVRMKYLIGLLFLLYYILFTCY